MSEANRTLIRTILESTYGTTPTVGAFQRMRFTSHNLAANPQSQVSDEIRSDRMVSDVIKVGENVGGDVGIELSMNTYDEWLEALLCGTWTTNVLKNGTTQRGFSVEVEHEDWAHYLQFKGMRFGAGSLNFTYGQTVTGSFSLVGKEALESATSLVTGTMTETAATTSDVVNGASDVSNILIDAGAPGSVVRSIQLNIDNTMRPIEGLGTLGPQNQAYGRSRVTGTLEMYFDDIAMYAKLLANTVARLQWTVGDGTNTLAFDIRELKFSSGVPAVTGVDTDVMIPLEFEAIYNATDDASITITRT